MSFPETTESDEVDGFLTPRYITDTLKNFFAEANLGLAFTKQHDGTFTTGDQLRNYLHLLLECGISSLALLTPLFSIYARVNEMPDPQDRRFLRATPLMIKYFSDIFSQFPLEDQQRLSSEKEQLANLIETKADYSEINCVQRMIDRYSIFDPNHFRYAYFQRIIARNRVPKEELSTEQLQHLTDPDVRLSLDDEQRIVSTTLEYYRTQK